VPVTHREITDNRFMDILMLRSSGHPRDSDAPVTPEPLAADAAPPAVPAGGSAFRHLMRRLLEMSGFHSRYSSTDYGRLHYFDSQPSAPARAVILLHGLGSSSFSLIPLACLLRRYHRVIVPDLMHFAGFSEPILPLLSTGDHVTTIDQLASALALQEIDLCGHSLGGGAAIHLAARRPERVRTLSLINPGGFSFGFERIKARFISMEGAPPAGVRALSEDRRLPLPASSRKPLRSSCEDRLRSSVIAYLGSVQAHDFVDSWIRHIACPTLLLWGEKDEVLPADIPFFVARELLHAEIHRLPRAGHLAVVEAPLTVARHLCRFWKALEPGTAPVPCV
jgi:pimeloyl-ACP methyl ester carboxylesterase